MISTRRAIYAMDCLDVLTNHDALPTESVDFIYLDPPFNKQSKYNLPFKGQYLRDAAPVVAFKDTWRWGSNEKTILRGWESGSPTERTLAGIIRLAEATFRERSNSPVHTSAYILNMALRLREMKRVLKPTGSICLHCDPTASHYLKLVMDTIFGVVNFRNEIIWHYGKWTNAVKYFQRNHDVLLYYAKDAQHHTFNLVLVDPTSTQAEAMSRGYNQNKPGGVRQLLIYDREKTENAVNDGRLDLSDFERVVDKSDSPTGTKASDVWHDIQFLHSQSKERLGYPTQKPRALLERLISASTNVGDIVLDPFCGCGTAVHAAEELDRQWIGVDISQFAAGLIRNRLIDHYGHLSRDNVPVIGCPLSISDAKLLSAQDPFEFEKWACGEIGAQGLYHPPGARGADGGIDGIIPYVEKGKGDRFVDTFAVVQVKSGKVTPDAVKALSTTVRESGGRLGVMICFERYMRTVENNREKRLVRSMWGDYDFIQGVSVEQLINRSKLNIPPSPQRVRRLAA